MKRAQGSTFTRLSVLEQQADKTRQERAKLQTSQIDAAINRLGTEDYDFMAGFFARCEHDPDLQGRTVDNAATLRPLDDMPPNLAGWMTAVYVLDPEAVIPPAPDGAAVWLRAAAQEWHKALEQEAAGNAELQDAARWYRGYFRVSANLVDVLEGEEKS